MLQLAFVDLDATVLRRHLLNDTLPPSLVKPTVPAGVLGVPGEVSFIEAVHVEDWPIWTEAGLQMIVVDVVRLLMVIVLEVMAAWPGESFVLRVTVKNAQVVYTLVVSLHRSEERRVRSEVYL